MKSRPKVTLLGAVLGCLASLVAPAPAQAHATTYFPPNTYYFDNIWAAKCLDGGAATLGTPAQLWTCNGTPDQQWTLVYAFGDASFEIRSIQSGGCLGIYLNASSDGTSVRTLPCGSGYNVRWTGGFTTGVGFGFTNAQANRALDADSAHGIYNGSKVQVWDWLYRTNQYWRGGDSW